MRLIFNQFSKQTINVSKHTVSGSVLLACMNIQKRIPMCSHAKAYMDTHTLDEMKT